MSRAGRLFDIAQALHRARVPVTAVELAGELDVFMRTVYRDVAALIARDVSIREEPGFGYVLDPGYFLPPLTFKTNELDAVLLELIWVEKRADRCSFPTRSGGIAGEAGIIRLSAAERCTTGLGVTSVSS